MEVLRELSNNLLKRVSGLYGDMWERQKNPFEHDRFKEAYDNLSMEIRGKVEYIGDLQAESDRKRLKENLADFENPVKIS